MTGVVGDAREPLDHRRDPRQGPEVRRKPMRASALAQRPIDTLQLGWRQFRFSPRPSGAAQRGPSTTSPLMKPTAHALSGHSQGAGDIGHDLARCKQPRRPAAAQFQGVEVSAWRHRCLHGPSIHQALQSVTLFCEIH